MKGTRRDPQLRARLPQDLMDYLKEEAEKNLRSVTAEITLRLMQSREQQERMEKA
jgi:uncharacterized protein (DUF2164 family)